MRTKRSWIMYAVSFATTSIFVGVFLYGANIVSAIDGDAITKRRAQLEAELSKLESLIEQQQVLLDSKQGERVSLERDLDIINNKIKKSQLAVEAQRVVIDELSQDIFLKKATALELEEKISREKDSLSGLIRRTAELDDQSPAEVIFSGKSFSDFFEEIDDFQEVKVALEKSFKELEGLRNENLTVAEILDEKRAENEELHELQKMQRARLENQEAEKVKVLEVTKGEEGKYQDLIVSTQKSAAQIRSELFELRGNAAINLGDAIEFATFAGVKTGVRPALILGVLKQETEFGSNVGGCTYNQILYGEPVMKPTRDQPVYLVILQTLGINPSTQRVSCSSAQNWGGAMGPTQFIPSTWACFGGYINTRTGTCGYTSSVEDFYSGPWKYDANQDRLRVVRGKQSPSNPWDNQDAFIATALYLKDLGADAGTAYAERLSALRYYAGSANATNPAYSFYGDNVMDHAGYFQSQIDALKSLSN